MFQIYRSSAVRGRSQNFFQFFKFSCLTDDYRSAHRALAHLYVRSSPTIKIFNFVFFPHYSIIVRQAGKQTNNILTYIKKWLCCAMFLCDLMLQYLSRNPFNKTSSFYESLFKLMFHKIIDLIKSETTVFTYNTIVLTIAWCLKDLYISVSISVRFIKSADIWRSIR